MNQQQTETVKRIREKIVKLEKLCEVIESLPDMEARQLYESCEEICMTIPYDPTKISKVRRALGSAWEVRNDPYVMENGSWVIRYQNASDSKVCLTLFADPYGEGATCKRVKVGVREEPIYKIVCGDELVGA